MSIFAFSTSLFVAPAEFGLIRPRGAIALSRSNPPHPDFPLSIKPTSPHPTAGLPTTPLSFVVLASFLAPQHCAVRLQCTIEDDVQERLLNKLGKDAFPFHLDFPPHSPNSVTLVTSTVSPLLPSPIIIISPYDHNPRHREGRMQESHVGLSTMSGGWSR